MKKILALSIIASGFLMASSDYTIMEAKDPGFYVGIGYSATSIDEDHRFFTEDSTWDASNVALIGGYNYNQFVAVEARYTTSVGDLSYQTTGFGERDYDGDMSNFGIYVKPQLPIGDGSIYTLLGYGTYSVDYKNEIGYDGSEASFQWGIGGSYRVTSEVDIFIDYTQFYNDSSFDGSYLEYDYDIGGYTFGVNYRF